MPPVGLICEGWGADGAHKTHDDQHLAIFGLKMKTVGWLEQGHVLRRGHLHIGGKGSKTSCP